GRPRSASPAALLTWARWVWTPKPSPRCLVPDSERTVTTLENRPVAGADPWTGEALAAGAVENSAEDVRAIVAEAAAAAPELEALGRRGRAGLLRALARTLEAARERIVAIADAETALGAARLGGEL